MRAIERVLVALDLRADAAFGSREVWRTACAIARTFGAELTAIHAIPEPADAPDFESARAAAHVELSGLLTLDPPGPGVRVATGEPVRSGSPADAIAARADEVGADLIVLGAGARAPLERVLLGSTAEQVIRDAAQPVWLVRPGGPADVPARILCAVDGSAPARQALAAAVFLAHTFVARLVLVGVIATRERGTPPQPIDASGAAEGERLRAAMHEFNLHGITVQTEVRRDPKPALAILDAVQEHRGELLILGSAGRRGLARWIQPNTAEKVLRVVPSSLLVLKQAEDDA